MNLSQPARPKLRLALGPIACPPVSVLLMLLRKRPSLMVLIFSLNLISAHLVTNMELDEGPGTAKAAPRDKESTLCLYPSKRCDNLRATKPNGQLHKFCQLHREKANYNQRQMLYKRRHEQQPPPDTAQQMQVEIRGPQILPKPPANNQLIDDEFELDEDHVRLIEEVATANVEDTLPMENQE